MYVDGLILFAFYLMLVIALGMCGVNYIEIRDLKQRLDRRTKIIKPPVLTQTNKISKPKGYWN